MIVNQNRSTIISVRGRIAIIGKQGARFASTVLAALLLLILGARSTLAIWASPLWAPPIIVGAAIAAYLTFVLEGLSISAGKLRDVERVVLEGHANVTYPRSAIKITDIGDIFRGVGYDHFIIGQQTLTLLLVLAIEQALDWLAKAPTGKCDDIASCIKGDPNWLHAHPAAAWIYAHPAESWHPPASWIESGIPTYLISSLLICWLFQLTPGLFANGREVGFLRIYCTGSILCIGRLAARLQLGYPGEMLAEMLRSIPWCKPLDDLGLSAKEVYDDLVRTIGVSISHYAAKIEIFDSRTVVTESTIYEFHSGSVRSFQHRVSPPERLDDLLIFDLFPTDLVVKKNSKYISEALFRNDIAGNNTSSESFCIEVLLSDPLPRELGKADQVTVQTMYELKALRIGALERNKFEFTADRPVRAMKIEIVECESIRLHQDPTAEALYPGELSPSDNGFRARPSVKRSGKRTLVQKEYLVHATRLELTLNATR